MPYEITPNDQGLADHIVNSPFNDLFAAPPIDVVAKLQADALQECSRAVSRLKRAAAGDRSAYHEAIELITGKGASLDVHADVSMLASMMVAIHEMMPMLFGGTGDSSTGGE